MELSQANLGLIRRDLMDQAAAKAALAAIPVNELVTISKRAAVIFATETLPILKPAASTH